MRIVKILQREISHVDRSSLLILNTDLLVLLCHHCKLPRGQLFLKSLRNNSKRPDWDIGHLIASLGPEICGILPFIHAIGGCDTTSRLYGIGKGQILKLAIRSAEFRKLSQVFCSQSSNHDEVAMAGEKAITLIYGEKKNRSWPECREGFSLVRESLEQQPSSRSLQSAAHIRCCQVSQLQGLFTDPDMDG